MSSSVKSPLGAIAGAVIGTLVLVIILLLFYLWRRKKAGGATGGPTQATPRILTPFPLNPPSQTNSTAISSTLTSQKSQLIRGDESSLTSNPLTTVTSTSPLSMSQVPELIIDTSSSNPQVPTGSNTSNSTSPQSLQRDGSSIRYLFTDHAFNGSSVIHSPLSSSANMYDNPPPSYFYLRNENDGQSAHRSSSASGTVTPKPS